MTCVSFAFGMAITFVCFFTTNLFLEEPGTDMQRASRGSEFCEGGYRGFFSDQLEEIRGRIADPG